eukprot:TRINITY_DN362_c0_g4_i2.p1 TRINITY_DN362_c0_g4~~TRINITY_DN362_c0_g4_i2.p1  ORF type:complete len:284 (+),score=68.91 TRINITY_DN362_c0_g4_i2:36-887(+)
MDAILGMHHLADLRLGYGFFGALSSDKLRMLACTLATLSQRLTSLHIADTFDSMTCAQLLRPLFSSTLERISLLDLRLPETQDEHDGDMGSLLQEDHDGDMGSLFAELVSTSHALQVLRLVRVGLTDSDSRQVAAAVVKCASLRHVSLSYNHKVSIVGALPWVDVLWDSQLETLELRNCGFSSQEGELVLFLEQLQIRQLANPTKHTTIRRLTLRSASELGGCERLRELKESVEKRHSTWPWVRCALMGYHPGLNPGSPFAKLSKDDLLQICLLYTSPSPRDS